jgi:hypothetical protein
MGKQTFVYEWRNKWLTAEAKSIADMAQALRSAAEELDGMVKDGFVLDSDSGVGDDYAALITTDRTVAKKWGVEVC